MRKTAPKKTRRKSRKKKNPLSYVRWIVLAVFLLLLYVFFTGPKSLLVLYDFYQERNELILEKQMLEAENERLLKEVERLQSDLKAVEKVAREKYNMKKDDEEVFKVIPE